MNEKNAAVLAFRNSRNSSHHFLEFSSFKILWGNSLEGKE